MLTKKELKQFKGVKHGYMPLQLRAELAELFRQTGYLLKAEDRNGPWIRVDTIMFSPHLRVWHDELDRAED